MKCLRPRPIQEGKLRGGGKTTVQGLNPEASRPRVAALHWGHTSLGSSKPGADTRGTGVMSVEAQASVM